MPNLLISKSEREHRSALARDHNAREAMLDALWVSFWDADIAWNDLVKIVEEYTREIPSG